MMTPLSTSRGVKGYIFHISEVPESYWKKYQCAWMCDRDRFTPGDAPPTDVIETWRRGMGRGSAIKEQRDGYCWIPDFALDSIENALGKVEL